MGKLNRRNLCQCGCGAVVKNIWVKGHHNRNVNRHGGRPRIRPIPIPNHHLCECGCDKLIASNKRYFLGHNPPVNKGKKMPFKRRKPEPPVLPTKLCSCNCGEMASPGKDFIQGHNYRWEKGKPVNDQPWNKGLTKEMDSRLIVSEESKEKRRGPKPEEFKQTISKTLKRKYREDEEFISHCREGSKKAGQTLKKRWKEDREFAKMMLNSLCTSNGPNNPEYLIDLITHEYYTGWQYTGNYSVIINGKNPDFVNEETKQIIEVYGDYWHDGEDPIDRAEIFAEAGYETLVIWENELKNIDNVIYKLKLFCGV